MKREVVETCAKLAASKRRPVLVLCGPHDDLDKNNEMQLINRLLLRVSQGSADLYPIFMYSMREARDFQAKMVRGEEERPAVVHLVCHGLAGVSGGPTTKFDLGEHVTWQEVMDLFAPRPLGDDEAPRADPHTHFFGNACQSWQRRGSQMARCETSAWSSILAWKVTCHNASADGPSHAHATPLGHTLAAHARARAHAHAHGHGYVCADACRAAPLCACGVCQIDVPNDDAIFVTGIYYELLVAHGPHANVARLVLDDKRVKQRFRGRDADALVAWPAGAVRCGGAGAELNLETTRVEELGCASGCGSV